MGVRKLAACTLTIALGAAACEGSRPSSVVVTDSAGITIVSNVAGDGEGRSRWVIAPDPMVEIGGGVEAEVPLYRVTAVSPLASGDVAVGTSVPPQVLLFDRAGALQRRLGREGEGPGEFSSVGSVVELAGDSIAVWDPDRRRISVFGVQGALQREVDLSTVAPASARASSNTRSPSGFTHILPAEPGSLIVFGEAMLGPGSEPVMTRHEMPAYRVATDGEVLASFGSFPGVQTSPGLATPFGPRTHAASSEAVFVVGTSESTEYRTYAQSGQLVRIVRWPDDARRVEGPFLDRWMEMAEQEGELGEYVLSAPRPDRYPAYDDILITDRGEVLVAEYPGPLGLMPLRRADQAPESLKPKLRMPARDWLVFDADGAWKATLTTPEGFEPYVLQGTALWGVHTDALDVESVRAYEVRRSPNDEG